AVAGAPGDTPEIYTDALADGVGTFDWEVLYDLAHGDTVRDGTRAVAIDYAPWGGVAMSSPAMQIPLSGTLEFSMHGGDNAEQTVAVQLVRPSGGGGPAVEIELSPGEWTDYSIPLADLGGASTIGGVWWQEFDGADPTTVYLDEVRIVEGDEIPARDGPDLVVDAGPRTIERTTTDPGSGTVSTVTVDFPHNISDDVYGYNFAPDSLREEFGITINRWGGNSTERYDHRSGTTNTGADWFFSNVQNSEQEGDDAFERENEADGTATLMTLPATGWVTNGDAQLCSYPTDDSLGAANNAGPQDSTQQIGASSCGNGKSGGETIEPPDPNLTSVPADEDFAAEWVRELVSTFGTAEEGGVEMYAVGNEPFLWPSTHADVHPEDTTRAEVIDTSIRWADAVKDVDPTAEVVGPVSWSGWGYYVSTEELFAGQRPGDVPTFLADYLTAMADAEASGGRRLIDRLAVNFYDDRAWTGGDALRLESTRTLWDPSYAPQDWWLVRDFVGGEGPATIPRLHGLIDEHYPGTPLAITEYNFGGWTELSGGLAQADALGIFGREGVSMATLWDPFLSWVGLTEEEFVQRPIVQGMRLYRNYDGEGGRFGDRALFAESDDESAVSIYAAERTSDGALTVVLVNKATEPLTSELTLPGGDATTEVYRYSGVDTSRIVRAEDLSLGAVSNIELPARSATVLVLDEALDGDAPNPEPSPDPDPDPAPDPQPDPDPSPAPTPPLASEGAIVIDAPASATRTAERLDVNDSTFVWFEQGPVTLTDDLSVNRATSGRFDGRDDEPSVIAAGTEVCSWYVFGNRLDDSGRLGGRLDFADTEILGVIHRSAELRASSFLGGSGTQYEVGPMESDDAIRLDGSTIDWSMRFGGGTDAMRIITGC
ncbi:MAG: glycoside hydrolase family 44 protein, partial [Actinomycetota bacterium]